MIRGILRMGQANDGGSTANGGGENNRRAGRVRCEGIATNWGDMINASASGCRLRTKLSLKPGSAGLLTINGPDGEISLRARIVWVRGRNWGKSEVGVEFVNVAPDVRARLARLAEFASRDTVIDGLTSSMSRPA